MFEYSAYNIITKEERIFWGRDFNKTVENAGLNPNEWDYYAKDYID